MRQLPLRWKSSAAESYQFEAPSFGERVSWMMNGYFMVGEIGVHFRNFVLSHVATGAFLLGDGTGCARMIAARLGAGAYMAICAAFVIRGDVGCQWLMRVMASQAS